MRDDLRFALRILRRQPIHALTTALTLALGIGATTAIFAVIDAAFLRPLPYRDPARLVGLNAMHADPDGHQTPYALSQIELVRWQAATHSFEFIESLEPRTQGLSGLGEPEVVAGGAVSAGLFPMLGVEPALGRTFTAGEESTDQPLAVIGDALWQRKFSGDPSVLGRPITLDRRTYSIVGVMPAGFHPLSDPSQVWIPLHAVVDVTRQNNRIMASAGRLRPGVTLQQAQAELAGISAGLAREFPISHGGVSPNVLDLRENLFGQRRPAFTAVAAGVLVLFLLACVNVVNLTLGQLVARQGEITVRAVIGAGRWRLVRLQLVQSGVLALIGGTAGLMLTAWTVPYLLALNAGDGQKPIDVAIDWRVAGFGAFLIGAATLVSGLVPVLRAHRTSFEGAIARVASGRVGAGRAEYRMRGLLVAAQVALAVILLCGAGVFLVSLQQIRVVKPGFTPDNVLTMQLMLPPTTYPDPPARATFVRRMLERIGEIPGVVAAGTTQTTFLPNQSMQTLAWMDGRPTDPENAQSVHIRHITPGYFRALDVKLVEGRLINDGDRIGTTPVCMVSQRLARAFWPRESAIGHRIRRTGRDAPWMTIVGVAADVMDSGLGVEQGPTLYSPYLQTNTPLARVSLVVRTERDPLSVANAVRAAVWTIDPLQPVDRTSRLDDVLVEGTSEQRFRTVLLAAFAAIGLALALVGIYGVTAAAVKARTWEVGVRLALGASPREVVWGMLRESGARVLAGAVVGVAVFVGLSRLGAGMLSGVPFANPAVLLASAALLGAASFAVIFKQASGLAHVSPASALRDETGTR